MLLSEASAQYALERALGPEYANNVRLTAAKLSRFAGWPLDLTDLCDDLLNRWLVSLERQSPRTVRNKRAIILTLWRWGFDHGLTAVRPHRIRLVKVPEQIPQAFLLSDLRALLAAADGLKGNFFSNGLPKMLWSKSFLLAYWDTALRLGDLLSVERDWIWPGGYLSIVQHKTGRTHRAQLRPETLALIEELCGDRKTGLVWPWGATRQTFYEFFRDLRKKAGLADGTSKWIRRASASYVEAANPGAGARHLGHRTPGLAEKAYFDPRIVVRERPLPPPLVG